MVTGRDLGKGGSFGRSMSEHPALPRGLVGGLGVLARPTWDVELGAATDRAHEDVPTRADRKSLKFIFLTIQHGTCGSAVSEPK